MRPELLFGTFTHKIPEMDLDHPCFCYWHYYPRCLRVGLCWRKQTFSFQLLPSRFVFVSVPSSSLSLYASRSHTHVIPLPLLPVVVACFLSTDCVPECIHLCGMNPFFPGLASCFLQDVVVVVVLLLLVSFQNVLPSVQT